MTPNEPDVTPTYIYNPSKVDFVWQYDGKEITLPSRKIVSFPKYLADHMAKHLAQVLASEDPERIHYEDKLAKHLKEIYVDLT